MRRLIHWLAQRHQGRTATSPLPDDTPLLFQVIAEKRRQRASEGRHLFQELERRRTEAAAAEPVRAAAPNHPPAATIAPTPALTAPSNPVITSVAASKVSRPRLSRPRLPRLAIPTFPSALRSRRILVSVPVLAVALAAVTVGVAYWTTSGTGAAIGSVGTLAQPGTPSGTDNSGDVDLSWSASTVTGGGLVKYHVERRDNTGPPWTDVCGSTAAAPITPTSCTDLGPAAGDYVYRVTAIYNSWTAVSDESDTVTVAVVDTTPPDFDTPALTITGTFGPSAFQWRSGTTVFYNPQGSNTGTFTVEAENVNDPESGIDKVNFPNLTGFSGGGDDAGSPYDDDYDWTSSSTASGSQIVTAYNGVGLTSTTAFTVTPDVTAPTVPTPIVVAGYYTALSVPVTLGSATDGGSGPDATTIVVERDETDLVGGVCTAAFPGLWSSVTLTAGNDTTVASGKCYRYRELQSDNVGNVGTSSASATAKVDTSAPTAPTPTLSNATGNTFVSGSTVYTNPQAGKSGSFKASASPTDAESAIQKVNFPVLTGFTSGDGDVATPGPYETTYAWSGAGATASGSKTVTAYNNANLTNTATFTVTPDTANPTGGTITANGSGSDSYNTTGTIAIATTNFIDGESGIASNVVTRATATLAGNACGTFAGADVVPGASDAGLTNACYRYTLTGTDNVGNQMTAVSAIIKVDTTKPVTTITLSPSSPNGNNGWYKGPTAPTFTLSGTDAHSGVATTHYQIDAGSTQTYTSAVSIPNGTHTITYWSVDNAGNTEVASTTATIKVDTAIPSGTITNPSAGNVVGTVLLRAATAADTGGSGVANVQYFYCSGAGCSPQTTSIGTSATGPDYQVSWDTTALPNGPYVLRATITDDAGNTTDTATIAVTINNNYTFVVSNPGTQTAGTAFGGFSIQLQVNGANASSVGGAPYTGSKTLIYSGTATAAAPNGTATPSSSVSFTNGLATVPAGAITLVKAATGVVLTVADNTPSPSISGNSTTFNVSAGTAARLAWTSVVNSSGSLSSTCLFTCTVTSLGNFGTINARISVTDSLGNVVSGVGSGHSASLTLTTSNPPTGSVSPASVTFPAAGSAFVAFTYTAPNGNWGPVTLTAATTAGTAYTSAIFTINK